MVITLKYGMKDLCHGSFLYLAWGCSNMKSTSVIHFIELSTSTNKYLESSWHLNIGIQDNNSLFMKNIFVGNIESFKDVSVLPLISSYNTGLAQIWKFCFENGWFFNLVDFLKTPVQVPPSLPSTHPSMPPPSNPQRG